MSRWLANPHQEGAAYRNFDKIFDRKTSYSCACGIPCERRMFIAYSMFEASTINPSTCCCMDKLSWNVTPSIFRLLTRVIPSVGDGGGCSIAASVWWFPWFWICSTADYSFLPKPLSAEFRRELNRSDRLRLPYRHRRRNLNIEKQLFFGLRSEAAVENANGPRPEPWTTEAFIDLFSDTSPPNFVQCSRSSKYDIIQL